MTQTVPAGAAGVPDALARTRAAIQPAMEAAIGRLSPDVALLASYHLGWADAQGRPLEAPGGKLIRPTLALLSAEAAWADAEVGVPGGVAVELVHNYSLIHDDIIDGDTERHHRPTVWAVFGVGPAIIAGDALAVVAQQVLLDALPHGAPASALLADATAAMIAGQADDIAFEKRPVVSVEECVAMCAAKTGALLGAAASIGAVLAGAPPATVGALRDYGAHLGLAFQAVDDLLGIWGDPGRTGKPAGNDLRRRKKSLPVVAALAAGGEDADELRSLVVAEPSAAPLDDEQVERAAYLVEACGGREWARTRAKSHLDGALGALERVRLSPVPHRALADLAAFVVDRES
ncbi:polyprenyl synthetase family protein [Acidiferrimicrobium sp. IK]|uniref:polyprenyl synthetase family protein n=1 Tax=Acidiferrimicrobium sp. IK TaxID=2871700 RepID=UPI0021CB2883|nr:polyprenyl synthetase family protein [Acidiferrimicrobium sp. IK]MCU4184531.1 polyprenyl synthetase family protein [Acidiferrimicrobium sp. IK]